MSDNSLYYFFSSTAQVLAALCALLAVFTQFKISELKDFMVGDGQSVWHRMDKKEKGYLIQKFEDHKTQLDRLRDAVARRSLLDILSVLKHLSEDQESQGYTIETQPKGPIYLFQEFKLKIQQLKSLKSHSKHAFIFSILGIIVSLFALIFIDYLKGDPCASYIVVGIVVVLVIIAFFDIYLGISKGLQDIDGIIK